MANMIVLLPETVSRSEKQFLRFSVLIIAGVAVVCFLANVLNHV